MTSKDEVSCRYCDCKETFTVRCKPDEPEAWVCGCKRCGATGPIEDTQQFAMDEWRNGNRRIAEHEDGPEEEDGPWAEGWESRSGQQSSSLSNFLDGAINSTVASDGLSVSIPLSVAREARDLLRQIAALTEERDAWKRRADDLYHGEAGLEIRSAFETCAFCHGIGRVNSVTPGCPSLPCPCCSHVETESRQFCELEPEGEHHDLKPGVVCIACYNEARAAQKTEACRITEYDGAYCCTTHGRKWGAITHPEGPCAGWQPPKASEPREHADQCDVWHGGECVCGVDENGRAE